MKTSVKAAKVIYNCKEITRGKVSADAKAVEKR
jgi:hypothetical protein